VSDRPSLRLRRTRLWRKVRRRVGRIYVRLRWASRRGTTKPTDVPQAAISRSPRGPHPMVLVVVIDGLRPDSIEPRRTPNLARLRDLGVAFTNARAVFPTGTRVNAASIVTGAYPETTGIVGNSLVVSTGTVPRTFSTQRHADLMAARRAIGPLLLTEDLGKILARHGMSLAALSSASTGSTLLLHPSATEGVGALVNGAFDPGRRVAYPDEVNRAILNRFGPAPPKAGRSRSRDALVDWTQAVLERFVIPELAPDAIVHWICEPDHTQHAFGVGSPEADRALANVDRHVGNLWATVGDRGASSPTDLVILSDHGATRYGGAIDVGSALVEAGLKATVDSDDVVIAANGPSAQLSVSGHEPDQVRAIVRFLQSQPWTGVIFTRPATRADEARAFDGADLPEHVGWVDGTFSLDEARLFHPERSCDVLLTFAWDDRENEFGVPGTDLTSGVGGHRLHSGHGGLSPWAMRTTLFAVGPSFRRGHRVTAPVGHVDLVPTILAIMGIDLAEELPGRVWWEAMVGQEGTPPSATERTLTVATRDGSYRASLTFSSVDGHRYLDRGSRLAASETG